jgi:hypothetical protein
MKPLANSVAPRLAGWTAPNSHIKIALEIRFQPFAKDAIIVGNKTQRTLVPGHLGITNLLDDPVTIRMSCGIDCDKLPRLKIHHRQYKNLQSLDVEDTRKI